jgi:tRNA modification GTPase
MHSLDDTIAAIASAPGGAARGIVRLSGPAVERCLDAIFRATSECVDHCVGVAVAPPPHRSALTSQEGGSSTATPTSASTGFAESPCIISGDLRLPEIHSPLPCDVYLWPAGRSYTGQRVAEFHTIGSPPLLESLLKTLCAAGSRLAEPGEFTLRAFLSGRIDLTQAEAVLGVIDAADGRQLQTALAQLAGGLGGPLHRLRVDLLELLAHLEAGFDFAEEDISFITAEEIDRQLSSAVERAAGMLEKMSSRNLVETAAKAVLVGRPNTGKSSLFNALAQNRGALVSATPGTTRDYLCAELDLDGVTCQLIDTAGIDFVLPSHDQPSVSARRGGGGKGRCDIEIEIAAQSAAEEQHQQAMIRILCLDATVERDEWKQEPLAGSDPSSCVVVLTKIDQSDVGQVSNLSAGNRQVGNLPYVIATSSVTGAGLDVLRRELRTKILTLGNTGGDVVAGTAARCRESLIGAAESLRHAQMLLNENAGEEFVAGEIRVALTELGRVVGAVYTDDVLDRIFSRFCVGK